MRLIPEADPPGPEQIIEWAQQRIAAERRLRRENRQIFGAFRWRYRWDRFLSWILERMGR